MHFGDLVNKVAKPGLSVTTGQFLICGKICGCWTDEVEDLGGQASAIFRNCGAGVDLFAFVDVIIDRRTRRFNAPVLVNCTLAH